jgi:hypothetical protein
MRLSHFPSLLSYLALVSAISGFVEPFDYSELNHLLYSELSHFNYNELSHFSYRAQSFYDFVSHSATVSSCILLENSVIHHCYSTQSFLLHCSAFCVLLQWAYSFLWSCQSFFYCYSKLNHFTTVFGHFIILSAIFATALSHFSKLFSHFWVRSVIFVWSGSRGSVGVACGSMGFACGTEPCRGSGSHRARVGHALIGSIDPLIGSKWWISGPSP